MARLPLLRLLPGKDVQTQGSIRYAGTDLVTASDSQLRSLRGNPTCCSMPRPSAAARRFWWAAC